MYGTPNKYNIRDFDNLSLVLPLDTPEGKSINTIEEWVTDMQKLKDLVGDFQSSISKFAIHEGITTFINLF